MPKELTSRQRIVSMRVSLWTVLLLAALGAPPAWPGFRLVDSEGQETLVSKGRVKELSGNGDGPQAVFDLGAARAWMSNPRRSVYWEGTIDELCATIRDAAQSLAKAMEQQVEAQLSKLRPDQRAQVEGLRRALAEKRAAGEREAAAKPALIKVERTDETATIAGQPTRKYRVLVDGELYQEDWLSTDPALGKEFALDKASALMSRVSSCAGSGDPMPDRAKGVDEGEVYRELYAHGWPLKAVSRAGGKVAPKSEIRAIEKRDIPDQEFRPPPGYRRASLAEVMFSAAGGGPPGN
ncbi:MAG: hypothetical protein HYY35_04625 [Deltaproteobacteria bacterium]|nr:hypothetical protein [Deltaproteobacteria bacterium]